MNNRAAVLRELQINGSVMIQVSDDWTAVVTQYDDHRVRVEYSKKSVQELETAVLNSIDIGGSVKFYSSRKDWITTVRHRLTRLSRTRTQLSYNRSRQFTSRKSHPLQGFRK